MASKGARLLHENSAGPRRLIMNRSCLATETEQREAETDSEGDNDDLGATALFCHGFPFDKQVPAFYHLRLFFNEEFRERGPALWACSSGGEGGVCVLGPSVRLALVRWSRLRSEATQTPARRAGPRVAKRNELVTKALVDS